MRNPVKIPELDELVFFCLLDDVKSEILDKTGV